MSSFAVPYQAPPAGAAQAAIPLTFAHANGYPPECYAPLLERLAQPRRVLAMPMRPLWPGAQPHDLKDWLALSDDLLDFMQQQGLQRVVGAGHSLGAIATLRAALKAPERFAALVLIEPVLMPPWVNLLWQAISALGLAERAHPLVGAARRRRQVFASRAELYESYRRKPIFRYIDDQNLRIFTDALVSDLPDGTCKLRYSVDWEVQIYATGVKADLDLWRGLPGLKMPILIIRGAETDTTWASTARLVQLIRPQTRVAALEHATHLAPLEQPQQIAALITAFLEQAL